ncbi:MAG TPA: hypothetical protein DCM02_13070 [Flavobacterium sp.]|nr:hypothetical protein [Flavobacterium sp.]
MNFELIRDIVLSVTSIVIGFGFIVFYCKTLALSIKIKKINIEIEKNHKRLNQLDIEGIKSDGEWDMNIGKDNKNEKQEKRKLEHSIKSLCREKKYYLEEISIYKLFKK